MRRQVMTTHSLSDDDSPEVFTPSIPCRLLESLISLDEIISSFVVLPQCVRPYLKIIEYLVHGIPWIIISFLAVVIAYSYRWKEEIQYQLLILFIGLILDLAAIGILKIVIQRERPPGNIDDQIFEAPVADRFSFPSGHTSRGALLATLGIHFCPPFLIPVFIILALLVAYSRVAMGRHFVGDVIAGLALGVALAFAVLCLPRVVSRWVKRLFV